MRKLTPKQKIMIDIAIKDAPIKQLLVWLWWEIFNTQKSDKLIRCITTGMTWYVAYIIAKNE